LKARPRDCCLIEHGITPQSLVDSVLPKCLQIFAVVKAASSTVQLMSGVSEAGGR
jgi:hypothetical protein